MLHRRDLLKSVGALPLAAVLADPKLAAAAGHALKKVDLKTKGGQSVSGYLGLPHVDYQVPTVILIHEWWGLNDQIKAVAAEFVKQGYAALAVDLMKGQVATTRDQAKAQTGAVVPEEALDTMNSWVDFMRGHDATNDKVGTVGWCFGGGWSLNTSVSSHVDATVIYYGRVNLPASDLKRLQGPVLGQFATQDKFINQKMVSGFESEMKTAGKFDDLTVHWYEADHAFANPTGSRYDEGDAKLAWERTLSFLDKHLK